MKTAKVSINTIEKVKDFCTKVTCHSDTAIDLCSGRYIVDAKSIMGIFSLNLTEPIELHIHAEDEKAEKILEELSEYIVD